MGLRAQGRRSTISAEVRYFRALYLRVASAVSAVIILGVLLPWVDHLDVRRSGLSTSEGRLAILGAVGVVAVSVVRKRWTPVSLMVLGSYLAAQYLIGERTEVVVAPRGVGWTLTFFVAAPVSLIAGTALALYDRRRHWGGEVRHAGRDVS